FQVASEALDALTDLVFNSPDSHAAMKTDRTVVRDVSDDVETWLSHSSIAMECNPRPRNPRSGRNGRPPSHDVFSGNGYQRSSLSGGDREHLSRRCRCGHGRRVA